MNPRPVAIPALLALSAIHQHLVREGLRTTAGLVVETGTAREVHHFAVLAGYGAEAVHPYLAMETLVAMHAILPGELGPRRRSTTTSRRSARGLSKIMSKMGVSTYMSYCGAQLFEAIGLESTDWSRSTSRHRQPASAASACSRSPRKPSACTGGLRRRPGARRHARRRRRIRLAHARRRAHVDADAIAKLQHSTRGNKFETYKEYAQIINDQSRRHMTLRGLFEFKVDPAKAIPVDEVEPGQEIVKRFATGAMSLVRSPPRRTPRWRWR